MGSHNFLINESFNNYLYIRVYRCIDENLPIHIKNIKTYEQVKEILSNEIKDIEKKQSEAFCNMQVNSASEMFVIDYFNFCLTGEDVNNYNSIIGGFYKDEKNPVPGLNQLINEYNTKNKDKKLPIFTKLYKQILSDDKSPSFRFDTIINDKEVYDIIDQLIDNLGRTNLTSKLKN